MPVVKSSGLVYKSLLPWTPPEDTDGYVSMRWLLQLLDTNGRATGLCASTITAGSSYGSAIVLGTNFLRAWYTVFTLANGSPQVILRYGGLIHQAWSWPALANIPWQHKGLKPKHFPSPYGPGTIVRKGYITQHYTCFQWRYICHWAQGRWISGCLAA